MSIRAGVLCAALVAGTAAHAQSAFDLGPGQKVLPPVKYQQLAVFPVVEEAGAPIDKSQLLTLAEGLKAKKVQVRELGGGGNVNRVNVSNKADKGLLLLAGEIILGGQQDRIIGKDTVVPPGEDLAVEVYCVEHGRWSGRRDFDALGGMVEAKTRSHAKFDSNQGRVWAEVAKKTAALKAETPTGTYRSLATGAQGEAAVKPYREHVGKALDGLPDAKRMVGYVAAVNGRVTAVEVFANPALFGAYRDRLLDALYVSVADVPVQPAAALPAKKEVDAFIQAAEAAPEEAVLDGKAARTMQNRGKEVKKSKVMLKAAGAAAKPVYQSYSADN
jgi:hypothetical protein